MPKVRTPVERAAGKLIATVQKEWHARLGEPGAEISEQAMNNAHDLLVAAKANSLNALLGGRSVADYLGTIWVKTHPGVYPEIRLLENALSELQTKLKK